MGKKKTAIFFLNSIVTAFMFVILFSTILHAVESQCARVKIEIKQELTLERQAFDAHMRINNGLTNTSLENIQVDVWFTDESGEPVLASSDPNNNQAVFFIRLDDMTNIDDVSGTGSVPADSSSDIHWLIIPSPGASNGLQKGTLYNVGATLTYTVGGEENVIEVNPDYIFVKPMPELTLDYFLPTDVYGDDPFTSEIEPSIPFSLGVRVKNSGAGGAKNLKIDSAQPKIVDNEQGLLINFYIMGSEVNGGETTESLLIDFGTIEPGQSAIGRWLMECTLSGRFVEFNAQYSHADELGGELTSLIDDINTHTLVQDVLVDLPGRDTIRDFLSRAEDIYTVYESDSQETQVTDLSASSSLAFKENIGAQTLYTLSTPVTVGFSYARLSDPQNGGKFLKSITRSDGKEIKKDNGWLSKTQDRETQDWDYFFNLFDINSTGNYEVVFDSLSSVAQKPVLQYITDKEVIEDQQVSFIVEASDPNGTIPALSAEPLPVGAEIIDNGDGTGIFDWTPIQGQKGIYYITFTASDGILATSRRVKFTVYDINDTDMDGMLDEWENSNFGVLLRDGNGDFDSDGLSDLQEFIDQTDPTLDESAPTIPDPLYPYPNVDVADQDPELVIENSSDTQNDAIDYEFEIYSDLQMTDLVTSQSSVAMMFKKTDLYIYNWVAGDDDVPVPVSESTTNWQVPVVLPDNARYYWRVRSSDIEGASLWAYQDFFVNTQNDPPSPFQGNSPDNESDVDTITPRLSIMNSRDIDLDLITYVFEVYEDAAMSNPVTTSGMITQGTGSTTTWTVNTDLSDNVGYFWRAIAFDGNGGETSTSLYSFYINTSNQAPQAPSITAPDSQIELESSECLLVAENASDANGDPLTYLFEIDTSQTFDSPDKQLSESILEGLETTSWQVTGLLENTRYYWRVKASDSAANSMWATSQFFVNSMNEAPSLPTIKNPGNNAWVDTRTPVLSVHPSTDPDQDQLEYRFEVYSNRELTRFVAQEDSPNPDWTITANLKNNTRYFWRAQAIDEHGVPGPWTDTSEIFINIDLVNETPEIAITSPADNLTTNGTAIEIKWEDSDPDSSAQISLYYDTDTEGEDGTLIISAIEEDLDDAQDSFLWDISSLDDGLYYLYAVISDEDTQRVFYNQAPVVIDRTPPMLIISPPGGKYEDKQVVSITSDDSSLIYYTLDGTDPDSSSTLYSAPLEVNESLTLKCIALDSTGNSSGISTQEYTISLDFITVNLSTDKGDIFANINVYVFDDADSYYGLSATTDAEGNALFDPDAFTPGTYRFHAGYLGSPFWSDEVQLPDDMLIDFVIPVENITVTISASSIPAEGLRVYLYSETNEFLGQSRITDTAGQVSFVLPTGVKYKLRTDYIGYEFWSDVAPVTVDTQMDIALPRTDIQISVSGRYNESYDPLKDIEVHLFTPAGTYLGISQITNENGQVIFSLPDKPYKALVYYLGQHFWTQEFTGQDTLLEIPMAKGEVRVSKNSLPQSGIAVDLFSESGTSLDKNLTTDTDGLVSFTVPEGRYQFRVNFENSYFWSSAIALAGDINYPVEVSVGQGQFVFMAQKDPAQPISGAKCSVFTGTNSYIGLYGITNNSGEVSFDLTDGTYLFRLDYQGSQFWSDAVTLPAQLSYQMNLTHENARVIVSENNEAAANAKVYLFSATDSYLGNYQVTDDNGEAVFNLPAGADIRFRIDYMDQQVWSPVINIQQGQANTVEVEIE